MPTQRSSHKPTSRWPFRSSLLFKQTAFVALVTIVTGGTLMLAASTFARRIVRDEIDQRLVLVATDRQALLQIYIHQQQERAALVASRTRLRQLVGDRAAGKIPADEFRRQSAQILADARRSAEGFLGISIADPQGLVITATDAANLGKNYGADPDFLEGRQRGHLGIPRRSGQTYQSLLTAPVVSDDGQLRGVVLIFLDVQPMANLLANRTGLGESGEVQVGMLQDTKIRLLLPSTHDLQLTDIPLGSMPVMEPAIRGQTGLVRSRDYRGVEVLAAYRPVGYRDWGLVVKLDAAEAYAPLTRFHTLVTILEVTIVLAGVILSYLLARRFTQPILDLADKAATIAAGDMTARTGLAHRGDEFGDLARAFDEMGDQIHRHVRRAEALGEASQMFAEVTGDYETLLASVARRVAELVGDTCLVSLVSDDGMWLEPLALHDVDPELLALSRSVLAAAPVRVDDSPISGQVFKSGEPVLISDVSASSLRQTVKPDYWPLVERVMCRGLIFVPLRAQEKIIGVLGLARHRPESPPYDQEDLKFATALAERAALSIVNAGLYRALEAAKEDLERRVADRTAQLEAANKDLESFSYSVAHDLRAPLRAIDGFSRLVVEDYAPRLPEEAQRQLRLVRENAQQMGRLIDDLLTFSRLGRQPLKKQRVSVTSLVRQVVENLQPAHEGREIKILIDDLPETDADPSLLKQVLVNLLSNALKFTRMRDAPVVEVRSWMDGNEPVYFVKDNGVGFDMQYANKLFGVFQRLHRAEEYDGTGVGLAIVQRIVMRHGGRVWAEAQPDKGATFYFTLGGNPDGGGSSGNPAR